MTRWRASATHFLISFVVLGLVIGLVVWRWYPPALFEMAKAGPLLSILVSVDLILGPALTAIVYRSGKKGLTFDLTFIAVVQLAALCYGLFTLATSRPVYLVATSDRFQLVFANELEITDPSKVPPAYRDPPWFGPTLVAAPLPADPKERLEAMIAAMTGARIEQQPARYAPYPAKNGEPMRAAIPAETAIEVAPRPQQAALLAAFSRYRSGAKRLAMLPLQSTRGNATVVLDAVDGRILGFAPIDPWPIVDAHEARIKASGKSP